MIDVSAWPGLRLVEQIKDGNRNDVWRGELDGHVVSVRRSRRSPASLQWELDLILFLDSLGFNVPTPITSTSGAVATAGIVVQTWLTGRPPETDADWTLIATELGRLHALTSDYPQRPGCCTVLELGERRRSVDADLDALPRDVADQLVRLFGDYADVPVAVVHGDPGASNLRICESGKVGLLDFDESRVDLVWHDLSPLGVTVLSEKQHRQAERLSHAWEAANGWTAEPAYARARLSALAHSAEPRC